MSFSRRNATILLDTNKTVVASWEDILPVNAEDFETIEEPPKIEEEPPKPVEEPPKPPEKPFRRERPRRVEAFNRRYSRNEKIEQENRPERPIKPRGDKNRRQSKRDRRK